MSNKLRVTNTEEEYATPRHEAPGTDEVAVTAGVAGLGLMGTSIVAALLSAGHRVIGLTRNLAKRSNSSEIVLARLIEMKEEGILRSEPSVLIGRLEITDQCADLAGCRVVIESIIEDLPAKKEALAKIEEIVAPDALIGSNTSAIPVSILQKGARHPERILGIHWAEPAHVTRFMEIICGDHTSPDIAERAVRLARAWGKEPTLVRRDIRGFIANRLMYAMMREAFYLVENGYATPADIDRSARNDMGRWLTLAGPFRYMDLTGIPAYRHVMHDLFPELCNGARVPKLMQEVVDSGARGVSNGRGFYSYTPEQAKHWEEIFLKFSYDIRALAQKYPENVGD
jgi:3-hydroxybutyryl-CoA dehydrogenase